MSHVVSANLVVHIYKMSHPERESVKPQSDHSPATRL